MYEPRRGFPRAEIIDCDDRVEAGDWDVPREGGFMEVDAFKALRQRRLEGKEWPETSFYQRVADELARGEVRWGCRTEADFRARCNRLDALLADIEDNGYSTQEQLGKDGRDEIRVAINRAGRFMFVDGRHRLSIARLLDVPLVPVRVILRHQEWEEFRNRIADYATRQNGVIYQQIDHPDLADIPAKHTTDRLDLVRKGLEGFAAPGKRLVDIGTHWGYMAQQAERIGFDATGIELNRHSADTALRLRDATESRYEIWLGTVFDYPEPESFHAVLALNIFHHFLKTEDAHAELVRFLSRLRAEMMIFQPHRHDPPGQMKNAFRNYDEQTFTAFVSEHCGLPRVDFLGRARDQRPIYRLSRD